MFHFVGTTWGRSLVKSLNEVGKIVKLCRSRFIQDLSGRRGVGRTRLRSLDRTTCMLNLYPLKKPGLTEAKVAGILVCGHEDGGIKTAMDIFLNFPQMGYILSPLASPTGPMAQSSTATQTGISSGPMS